MSGPRIVSLEAHDVRFPTSDRREGSDAMHPDPDYSAAYVILRTEAGLEGHGLTFTIGRGNELCVAAAKALALFVVGRSLVEIRKDFAGFWRSLVSEPQLRWVGPEKGVLHLATAAVVNAVWDLAAKAERKPLWKLLADFSAEELVGAIDFRYLSDVLTPQDALEILRENDPRRREREEWILERGYPAYTTSAGWIGYSDEEIRAACAQRIEEGWTHFKIKVGTDPEDDQRRAAIVRGAIGPSRGLMLDANQCWDVDEAIANAKALSSFDPLWIEEPTSPDDVLGHATIARAIAPVGVATGEHCANRVLFKQLLQAGAIGFCQVDACRLGGLNEVLAVLLLARKFDVPVCPHAGGVGLCEYVSHIVLVDYLRISGTVEGRLAEWVDPLHEPFESPAAVRRGRYLAPVAPGYGVTMKPQCLRDYAFPDGPIWRARRGATG